MNSIAWEKSTPVYQISSKSDEFLPRYGNKTIHKMTSVCHLRFLVTSQGTECHVANVVQNFNAD